MKRIALAILAVVTLGCSDKKPTNTEQKSTPLTEKVQKLKETTPKISPEEKAKKLAKIDFTENSFEFGKVDEGAVVTHVFKFKNTGKQPLIINNIRTSCGCTTPEYTRTPVAPGTDGKITVRFNTKGKRYKQVKSITVIANTDPSSTVLQLKGEVTPAPDLSNGPVRQ